MTKLVDVEGIGKAYAEKLEKAGIKTEEELLKEGATPKGRKGLAEKSGISDTLILKWVNRVDLSRVKGVGSEYADLLEASGVDTVVELGKRKPDNLLAKMQEVNTAKKLVRKMPVLTQVEDWVKQAASLPRILTY
jgi:predicted flap endonuclease-1-like 5' DNA nuclease